MNVRRPMVLAFLMIACILFVFVSPALNLPQSALRAQQNALRMLMGMVMFTCTLLLVWTMRRALAPSPIPLLAVESLVDFTCTRRC